MLSLLWLLPSLAPGEACCSAQSTAFARKNGFDGWPHHVGPVVPISRLPWYAGFEPGVFGRFAILFCCVTMP